MTADQVKAAIVQIYSYVQGEGNVELPEPKDFVGRALEELVELALALGTPAGQIFEHVADALANEARKQQCYPSELQDTYLQKDRDIEQEIADSWICLNMITSMLEIPEDRINELQREKTNLLIDDARNGRVNLSARKLFYRTKRNGNNQSNSVQS